MYMTKREHTHIIQFSTSRNGGRTWGSGGGYFRESEVYCSCGWSERQNGQSRAESTQYAKEHLREVGQYYTESEKEIYVHAQSMYTDGTRTEYQMIDLEYIMYHSGRSKGIVKRALRRLIKDGLVVRRANGFQHTTKEFNWSL